MPHTLRAVTTSDEEAAALSMLTGFDLDLARQVNQTKGRIRCQSFTQTPPSPRGRGGALAGRTTPSWRPVAAWPTPADLKHAGKARIDARLKKHGCRRHATWAGQIVSALEHQTVVVAGTDAAATVLPHLARQLIAPRAQRADVAAQVEALVEAHPLYEVLISMPGIGVRTAAVLAGRDPGQDLQAPEPSWPPTPGSLPSHAALAHRSVVRCVSHGGNKRLKRAMFPSAFASLRSDPVSQAYYQRKRDQGKPPWARPSSPWPTAAS